MSYNLFLLFFLASLSALLWIRHPDSRGITIRIGVEYTVKRKDGLIIVESVAIQ